ncbi:M48 family metallopeptidase [Halococcus salsus]|uniref:M48 family metallopeptidase n=1 Tax=Halococcus salsus TaxID=2162894 RepID=UPI001359BDBD|nr:SprT family zinc-dependent metalloprotease [Halococcus salsus]
MPEAAPREVDLFGETVSYEVRRSDEADDPRIDIDIHDVVVVLPRDSETDPEELLAENAAWVMEKKQKYDSFRETIPDRTFEAGATFPYFGDPHEIVVEHRPASTVEEGAFKLARHHVEQTSVQRALETLYRRKARETFEERADHYADEMCVEYKSIELRNQRTRWGSCSTSGTLSLNWRLMMAPSEIIDYIVVHELAHLREPNHNGTFWSLVVEYDPEYKARAEWLNENSTQLIFTEDDL